MHILGQMLVKTSLKTSLGSWKLPLELRFYNKNSQAICQVPQVEYLQLYSFFKGFVQFV